MSEIMTLLTSATGHAIVKSFSGTDVNHQPFSIGKIFNMSEEGVSYLKSLSRLLNKLENEPAQTTIRVVSDKCKPVSTRPERLPLMPHRDHATRRELCYGSA